ncbi:unnamed protein product [Nyctereutes procyonoides]|uniref:(raccoon dog) hypothetical protein n=1 Tax=Nyctereutes procyonoides TaxID=34880 RepID=A0A811XY31_NYCPR|nr:unnamed protein product [Nyctereutes procyonoides]
MDTCLYFARNCYSPDFEKLKPEYLDVLPEYLVYNILDVLHIFESKCLEAFPNLKDFMAHFEGLKKMSASCFLPGPLFLKIAVWGNK